MYTKEQVDEMLSQVEQEFENALGSIAKSEENIEEENDIEVEENEELEKAEFNEEYDDIEDYETIDELYASMEKNEIEAHYESLKRVMLDKFEELEKNDKRDHAEGDSSLDEFHAKAKKDSDYDELSEHGKTQRAKKYQKEASQAKFGKSEENAENEMLKSENEELKKSYEELKNMVDQLFNVKKAPAQKAVTNVNYIAKSEESNSEEIDFSEMSKNEITAKLKTIDYSGLKKSDREAINNYYLDNGSVDSIKHLIRE